MNDDDLKDIYRALVNFLSGHEYMWVTEQIAEQIRLGKTENTEIELSQSAVSDILMLKTSERRSRPRRSKKEAFQKTREYTPKESLLLLIDAIEQAVLNTNIMVYDTLRYFNEEFGVKEIMFYSEETQASKTFTLDDFSERELTTSRLKKLLDELRRRIDAN